MVCDSRSSPARSRRPSMECRARPAIASTVRRSWCSAGAAWRSGGRSTAMMRVATSSLPSRPVRPPLSRAASSASRATRGAASSDGRRPRRHRPSSATSNYHHRPAFTGRHRSRHLSVQVSPLPVRECSQPCWSAALRRVRSGGRCCVGGDLGSRRHRGAARSASRRGRPSSCCRSIREDPRRCAPGGRRPPPKPAPRRHRGARRRPRQWRRHLVAAICVDRGAVVHDRAGYLSMDAARRRRHLDPPRRRSPDGTRTFRAPGRRRRPAPDRARSSVRPAWPVGGHRSPRTVGHRPTRLPRTDPPTGDFRWSARTPTGGGGPPGCPTRANATAWSLPTIRRQWLQRWNEGPTMTGDAPWSCSMLRRCSACGQRRCADDSNEATSAASSSSRPTPRCQRSSIVSWTSTPPVGRAGSATTRRRGRRTTARSRSPG